MKRVMLVSVMVLSMMMIGCGSSDEPTAVVEVVSTATSSYYWTVDGVDLKIDDIAANTVDLISEEAKYFEAESCAYNGIDKIYTYNDYSVTFYEGEGRDGISAIAIMSDLVETNEGIAVGSTEEEVRGVYGEPVQETETLMLYEDNSVELRIILGNGKVTSIQFNKLF